MEMRLIPEMSIIPELGLATLYTGSSSELPRTNRHKGTLPRSKFLRTPSIIARNMNPPPERQCAASAVARGRVAVKKKGEDL